ncbi:serine/threonine-protein phosphatase [Streptomyces sp. or43]|nr:serine/threonine-protein phosphatase [Streptomyces sp. or43]
MTRGRERMFQGLLDASHGMSLENLPDVVREQAAHAGLREASIYLADLQEDVLRLVTGHGLDAGGSTRGRADDELPIDGTPAGRAYTRLTPQRGEGAETGCWWTPLLDGAERVGVLRVENNDSGELTVRTLQRLASLVTLLILSVRTQSDSYARLVRTRPMTVAAELQWNLMPPRAFASGQVTISAALEPAYGVGGDAFDYALADDVVHLGVFDAMGHDVAAGLTANMAVAACRNARRQNATLIETGEFIERTLIEQLGNDRYVTAALIDLDTRTGEITWTSHAHHSPVVVREGTWTGLLPCPPSHPLGTDLGIGATLCREQLNPGDRLVLYTDGITEARSPAGEEFGLERFMDFILAHNAEGLPVPETLRRLIHSVLDYQKGQLQDDATVLFLEWHGPTPTRQGFGELRSHPDEPATSRVSGRAD